MLQPNDIAIICEAGHTYYGVLVPIQRIINDDVLDTRYQSALGITFNWWQLMTPEEFYGKESTQTYLEQSSR